LYDFANSPYSTIMTTLIFPIFFMEKIVSGKWALLYWALLYGGSEIASAFLSPPLGAMSDILGRKKRFLTLFALLSITATFFCSTLSGGDLAEAVIFFSAAQIGFALSNVFYNSLLNQISDVKNRETISGFGWGMGYLGGMLFMAFILLLFDLKSPSFEQKTILWNSVWYLVFSIPVFFFIEKEAPVKRKFALKESYQEVLNTIKTIKDHKTLFYFMISAFFFNDAVNSAILFGGIFLKKGFGFDFEKLFVSFILFNLIAALGAFILGPVADKITSKRALFLMIFLWCLSIILILLAKGAIFLIMLASLVGILIGATQSVLRGYLSKLAPVESQGEWFGFYSLMGKAASLIGPLLFGVFYGLTNNVKISALSLLPLFLLAAYFLKKVEENKPK
ncbi:MAG: MFS transporter, partial [Acidobacteria bacterium]|nr:MFS transporter [Acidobacteriota bacterium]